MLQKNFSRAQEHLINLRKQADELIVSIWNEVEETFKDLPPSQKRDKSKAYGLVYVYRKNEIRELKNENLKL